MSRTPPPLTAGYALRPPLGVYTSGSPDPTAAIVRPMASESCVSACVGPGTADYCDAKCAGDMACWQTCTGSAYPCVQRCLSGR